MRWRTLVLALVLAVSAVAMSAPAVAHYLPNRECVEYYPWNEIKRVFLYVTPGKAWYWVTWANVSTQSTHKDTCFEFHA